MRKRWVQATLAIVLAGACGGNPASPAPSSLSAGRWAGTTAQGAAISFEVSSEEALTSLTVGYRFNGCSGTQTFANLNISTAPNILCIPGPCSGTISSYRSLSFTSGAPGAAGVTTVNGLFLPGGHAQGRVFFQDYPGCGTALNVDWSATRR